MKKLLIACLAAGLLLGVGLPAQAALTNEAYGIEASADTQASMLQRLGLFNGTDKGFELGRGMTRDEAAAMLVRYLGAEKEALAKSLQHPFNDVEPWAAPYVGWLYQAGLTKGISSTRYGAQEQVTAIQYCTFLSRAVSGTDEYLGTIARDEELKTNLSGAFTRGDAVVLSVRALGMPRAESGGTVAAYLIKQGLFTVDELRAAGRVVLPCGITADEQGFLIGQICGVPYARGDEGGFTADRSLQTTRGYQYAVYKLQDGILKIYLAESAELKTMLAAEIPLPADAVRPADSMVVEPGGNDILVRYFDAAGKEHTGALLRFTPFQGSEELISAETLGDGASLLSKEGAAAAEDGYLLQGSKALYLVSEDGVRTLSLASEPQILLRGETVIAARVPGENALVCLDAESGEEVDRYPLPASETLLKWGTDFLYGESGLYLIDAYWAGNNLRGTMGRLTQLTDRPILDMLTIRWSATPSDPYVLTRSDTGAEQLALLQDGQMQVLMDGEKLHLTGFRLLEPMDTRFSFEARNDQDAGAFQFFVSGDVYIHPFDFRPDQGTLTDAQRKKIMLAEVDRLKAAGGTKISIY